MSVAYLYKCIAHDLSRTSKTKYSHAVELPFIKWNYDLSGIELSALNEVMTTNTTHQ